MPKPAMDAYSKVYWLADSQLYSRGVVGHAQIGRKLPYVLAYGMQVAPQGDRLALVVPRSVEHPAPALALCKTGDLRCRIDRNVDIPVGFLRWSPHGNQLAILRAGTAGDSPPVGGHLYIYDVPAGRLRPIVTDRLSGNRLEWSSDGRSIYVPERRLEKPVIVRIWKVDIVTKHSHLVLDGLESMPRPVRMASPSPDGSSVLLVSGANDKDLELAMMDFRKKTLSVVARGDLWSPAWSPRSDRFAISVDGNLWIIERSSLKAKRVPL